MASWQTFADEVPELAAKVRARFEASTHHVLGTLRADGTPRLSGSEVAFWGDDVVAGSMPGARKARDLQRDPRCAVHANPSDPEMAGGDAKFDARAVEVVGEERTAFFTTVFAAHAEADDEADDEADAGEAERRDTAATGGEGGWEDDGSHLFRFDLTQVVLTEVDAEAGTLTVNLWQPGEGLRRMTRT